MSVIIFGSRKKDVKSRIDRSNEEEFIEEVPENISKSQIIKIIEFQNVGIYEKEKPKPLKVMFQSNQTVNYITSFARDINNYEEYKSMKTKRDQNRDRIDELKITQNRLT